jgi:HPt (histidine-containing phosphotransfer) domain-containing protein
MSEFERHIDTDAIAELKEVMDEEFPLLIETFVNDSVARIKTIQQAVTAADPEAIHRAAHNFKGSASNMAASALTELCGKLEEIGHNGESDGAQNLLNAIIDEYAHVRHALENI